MRSLLILLPSLLLAQAPAPKPASAATSSMTDEQKSIYAIGLSMYRSLSSFDLTPAEIAIVEKALTDAANGKPAVDLSEWGPKINTLREARMAKQAEKEKAASAAYI